MLPKSIAFRSLHFIDEGKTISSLDWTFFIYSKLRALANRYPLISKYNSLITHILHFSPFSQLQFFIAMLKVFWSLYIECDFPLWMQLSSILYGVTIITLFGNFYYQAYVNKTKSKSNLTKESTGQVYSFCAEKRRGFCFLEF